MDDLVTTLVDSGLALARQRGQAVDGRRDAWIARLRVNLPELEALASLSTAPPDRVDGYLTPKRGASVGELASDRTSPAAPGFASASGAASISGFASASGAASISGSALAARAHAAASVELRAFTGLAPVASIEDQASAASLRSATRPGLPLAGIPIAVKDLMQVKGFVQTNGSAGGPTEAAVRDAVAIARMRSAGAIVIGVTNLHEYAYGITSENPHFGAVVNPRAPDRLPGGSSGGSAAAVAAGIVPIAIGTDTAGSIRIPAACCGVVGFKPTFDAIPRDGVQALSASLDHVGPIAASVMDAARAFAVMSGQSMRDAPRGGLAGLRVGVPRRHFFSPLAVEVAKAVEFAIEAMRADGARVIDVDVPGIGLAAAIQFATLCSEATDALGHRLDHPEHLGPDVRVRIEIGQCLPAVWYVRAQCARAALAAGFDEAMQEADVLVMPTLRTGPPARGLAEVPIGNEIFPLHTALTALTMPFNLCGMPAITLPVQPAGGGIPIGLQIAGRRGDDWRVLGVGARVEELLNR